MYTKKQPEVTMRQGKMQRVSVAIAEELDARGRMQISLFVNYKRRTERRFVLEWDNHMAESLVNTWVSDGFVPTEDVDHLVRAIVDARDDFREQQRVA